MQSSRLDLLEIDGDENLRKDFIDHLLSHAKVDSRIVLLTGDLGYNVLEEFRTERPTQFFNLGVAEQSLVSIAAGMASKGFRPFVYSIGNFPTMRCLEQIRNDVVFMELPVTIVALGAGFAYGTSGYSHYLIEDFSALSSLSIDIYSPEGPQSAKVALDRVLEQNKPAYIRLGRGHEQNSHATIESIGVKETLIPSSIEVILLSIGPIASEVDRAVLHLQSKVNALHLAVGNVSNLRKVLEKISQLGIPVVTVEEHVLRGGFGSLVLEMNPKSSLKVMRIGIEEFDRRTIGSQEFMRKIYGLDSRSIFEKTMKFLSEIQKTHG